EALLLAGTNQERLALVGQLRQALQAEGTLGQNALAVSSLRRKDLTQVQAQYLIAYEPGDVLMPTQDYKKQGLAKYQHYTVRSFDRDGHRLVVETADGRLLSIDPVQCKRKTVYAAQPLNIAVGDRLRWTKNNRTTQTRNGQQFTVTEVLDSGIVRTVDEAGQARWFSLSGHQHVDYAWVSTTYSSQGKTADRVLALMSDKTTNREAFYVAVSRAKHGLRLYAADKVELLKRSQTSRAKENASDYISLFQVGENYAKTQKERQSENRRENCHITDDDGRDIGKRIGECLEREFASQSSTYTDRHQYTHSANEFSRAGTSADDCSFEPITQIFDGALEPLSCAITEYAEQSEFIAGEGLFAEAVAAANHGFEQLERSAKNRNQLAAAVDRFDAAVRGEADSEQPELVEEKATSAAKDALDYKAHPHQPGQPRHNLCQGILVPLYRQVPVKHGGRVTEFLGTGISFIVGVKRVCRMPF
ncbi:MAG: ATP-binding domain-containing protein, partial [Cyanobacteria bacterium J06555_13]